MKHLICDANALKYSTRDFVARHACISFQTILADSGIFLFKKF